MLRTHHLVSAAVLFASLQTAVVTAEPVHEPAPSRDTAVGRLIAEQGNRALEQIRGELRDALGDQPLVSARLRVAVVELPSPQP